MLYQNKNSEKWFWSVEEDHLKDWLLLQTYPNFSSFQYHWSRQNSKKPKKLHLGLHKHRNYRLTSRDRERDERECELRELNRYIFSEAFFCTESIAKFKCRFLGAHAFRRGSQAPPFSFKAIIFLNFEKKSQIKGSMYLCSKMFLDLFWRCQKQM